MFLTTIMLGSYSLNTTNCYAESKIKDFLLTENQVKTILSEGFLRNIISKGDTNSLVQLVKRGMISAAIAIAAPIANTCPCPSGPDVFSIPLAISNSGCPVVGEPH